MYNKVHYQKAKIEDATNWCETLIRKDPVGKAINKNSVHALEKIIKDRKISDFYPLFLYALRNGRENIVKYFLDNEREYLNVNKMHHPLSPFIAAASKTSSRCLPLLLSYDFNPVSEDDKYIVARRMQECVPSMDCIYKLFKMMMRLAEVALNIEASNMGIFSKEDTEQKIDKALSDISKGVFLYHLGSYYENLFSSASLLDRKHSEIMQIAQSFPVFNWIIGAVSYRDIYLIEESFLSQTMKCHQRLESVKPGGEVAILGWGESMHALKCMSTLLYMLESSNNDDVQDRIIKHNNDHMHLDSNTVEKLIDCNRYMVVNCLKERVRALRWLCGFHKKYIQC